MMEDNFKKILIQLIFVLATLSAQAQTKIQACYGSSFAIVGWFGTHIKFNEDSTFVYRCAGDLFYDKASGKYRIDGKFVNLIFNIEPRDTVILEFRDSLGNIEKVPFVKPLNSNSEYRPTKFKIRGNKLSEVDQRGKIIRKEINYRCKKRKYFLIGHQAHDIKDW